VDTDSKDGFGSTKNCVLKFRLENGREGKYAGFKFSMLYLYY
jgi:hypothetical protein